MPQGDGTGNCRLIDIEAHDVLDETLPWRWTSHDIQDPIARDRVALAPELGATYDPYSGGFEEDLRTPWHLFELDIPRWIRERLVIEGETFPGNVITTVPGVFWTHTRGEVDRADYDLDPRRLASHYWSGPVARNDFPTRPPFPCIEPIAPFLGSAIACPFCPGSLPQPWITFPGFRPGCVDLRIDIPFLELGGSAFVPAPDLALPGIELFANDPGPWASAVESGDALGLEGVRYVKLEDGALVTRSLFERDGHLVEGQPTCPPTVDCLPFPVDVVAQAVLGAHPEPRTGHAVVLSATREALFVFGGRSRDELRELHDAWRFDVRDARWEQLVFPAGPSFGRILAATYSAARDTLFVLDELTPATASGPRQQLARLIAVHPRGGVAEVVASWPRLSGNDAYALAPGASGELWVAGSPVPGRMHTVARLVLDEEGWRVDGWLRSGGALRAGAAHASREGLTLVIEQQSRGAELVAVRVEELRDQPHGERACF